MKTLVVCKFQTPNKEALHYFNTKKEANSFIREMEAIYGDKISTQIAKASKKKNGHDKEQERTEE